ncbi:MAG: NYN domain-containing protein [Bryobacteraceae bacterium]|jgi:hypothetical protein
MTCAKSGCTSTAYHFYYAIKNSRTLPIGLGWCDFRSLGEQFLGQGEELERVRYFTTEVTWELPGREGEKRRQRNWLDALESIQGLNVIAGRFSKPDDKPREEKWTDVNIAIELLLDAADSSYDRAFLLTGDSDLAPAARAVPERIASPKSVTVLLPPEQSQGLWQEYCGRFGISISCKPISERHLLRSILPYRLRVDGRTEEIWEGWRLPDEYLKKIPAEIRPDRRSR